jgi:hypothetical protein
MYTLRRMGGRRDQGHIFREPKEFHQICKGKYNSVTSSKIESTTITDKDEIWMKRYLPGITYG